MPRTILFDVDGVLIHGYHAKPEFRKCWDETMEADLGLNREHFQKQFIFGPFVQQVLVGAQSLQEALTTYLPTTNARVTAQEVIDYWMRNDANINQPLLDAAKRLKATGEVRLFLATNQEHTRAAYLMQTLAMQEHFEDIFHSARIGTIKPNQAYFQTVSDLLGPQTEPPIFFDDTQNVVDAANAFGWQAHQFDTVADLNKNPFVANLLNQ